MRKYLILICLFGCSQRTPEPKVEIAYPSKPDDYVVHKNIHSIRKLTNSYTTMYEVFVLTDEKELKSVAYGQARIFLDAETPWVERTISYGPGDKHGWFVVSDQLVIHLKSLDQLK